MNLDTVNGYSSWGAILGIIIVGIMNKIDARRSDRLARESKAVAVLTQAVAVDSRSTMNRVHDLENNKMSIQLKRYAFVTRRLASITHSDEDSKLALDAERHYIAHMSKQSLANDKQRETDAAVAQNS